MTREFYQDLVIAFPEFNPETKRGFRISGDYEQFIISKNNSLGHLPESDIRGLAAEVLKKLPHKIGRCGVGLEPQGAGSDDIIISFNPRRGGQLHFMAIYQQGFPSILISLSWHGAYGLTQLQHKTYLEFLRRYFEKIPYSDEKKIE